MVLSVAGIGFAMATTLTLAQRWQEPSYAMPGGVVILAAVCTVLTVAGTVIGLHRHNLLRAWLTVLIALLFEWGFLAIFSIGSVLLIAALITLVVRVRLAEQRPRRSRKVAVGAGLVLSLGLAPLSELAVERPVVQCDTNGVTEATPIWTWIGSGDAGVSGSGSGSSSSNVTTGSVTVGGNTYRYVCAGDRLERFSQR